MRKHYTDEEKAEVINRYLCGETIMTLSKSYNISRSTIYNWINIHHINSKRSQPVNMHDYHILQQKCEKLQNIIAILKNASCTVNAPLQKKYEIIKEMSDTYSITTLCEALNVAKGSYYNHVFRNKNENTLANQRRTELKTAIEKIYIDSNQIFGARKITSLLNEKGYHTSYNTVSSIMRENGWFSIRNGAKFSYRQEKIRKENILNQQFNPSHPNEVWVSDITYFKYNYKTFYICVVIDLYARKVIAHRISLKNSTQLTKSTFKKAYESRNVEMALLFHSDRGSNYVSATFMKYLNSLGVKQSFSRKSLPYDNSVCESFFSNLKREELYRIKYRSENEFRESVTKYIEFYNTKRPHMMLNYRTPESAEAAYYNKYERFIVNK